MDRIITLALPCRFVTLQVMLGPERGMTTLTELVARAISGGIDTIEELGELFVLPDRIVLDVVRDLWSAGHVSIDFDSSLLELTESAQAALVDEEKRLESDKRTWQKFLLEPISGQFFAEDDGVPSIHEGLLGVPLQSDTDASDLPHGDLLVAVRRVLERERAAGKRSNVRDVSFGNPLLRPPTELRYLRTRVSAHTEPATGRMAFTVREGHKWGARASRRLTDHLADFVERYPEHVLTRTLTKIAGPTPPEPVGLGAQLARLERKVAGLSRSPASEIAADQEELQELAFALEERLDELADSRASAHIVERSSGQLWATTDLIKRAERQIVISSPQIEYEVLHRFLPVLDEALRRGVQLALLWGRQPEETLPQRVDAALSEMLARYPAQVSIDTLSAQTNACVVIQDNLRALVGSTGPLARGHERDSSRIAVLVEPAADGPATPRCVTDLLVWARDSYPTWGKGQRIDLLSDTPRSDVAEPVETSAPLLPEWDAEGADASTVRLWAESWTEHHAALVDVARRMTNAVPSVELVRDNAHRKVVSDAVSDAARRLAVTDDRIDPRVANDRLARVLTARAEAGVLTCLLHPGPAGAKLDEAFDRLGAGPIHVRHGRAGIRAVLSDDQVLMGCFSPLAEGEGIGRSRRTQVGLKIHSAVFADSVAAAIALPTAPARTEPAEVRQQPAAAATALPLLIEARGARAPGGFAAVVVDGFARLADPWEVLDRWERAEIPAAEMRKGVAVLLSREAWAPPGPRARWAEWLADDAWGRRSFVEAALAGTLLPAGPRAHACIAAAALEVGPLGALIFDEVTELANAPGPAGQTGALSALAELLLWGSDEGDYMLRETAQVLPCAWRELGDEALGFHDRVGAALPLSVISMELTDLNDRLAAEETWRELAAAIDQLGRLRQRFSFVSGREIHDRLFAPDGLFTRIRAACDTPGLRPELRGALPVRVIEFLDGLVREAGMDSVQWGRQRGFLKKTEAIVSTARNLCPAEPAAGHAVDRERVLDASRRFGREMARRWDDLFTEAEAMPHPYNMPFIALLEKLGPLSEWAKELS
ncbi:hypothetical protein [Actinomadura mexicana]|uniref:Uncharacterized protein n=1 Tax=Actinomadura mexicana TaxID=134959 RepID=A0A239BYQ1_9ACTN|nr:hypothetical protein [Actinomadura mexicana]SNS13117.1 hypothetical protein SAMN06265355_111187 [Actinomadura mexicana]